MAHEEGYWRYFAYLNSLPGHDADPDPREQLSRDVHRMGRRRALLVPAHRLLLRDRLRARRRQESVHRQPHRRLRLSRRDVPDVRVLRQRRLRAGVDDGGKGKPRAVAAHVDLPAAVPRRVRQVRADSSLHLVARRDGGSDAGLRPHPRRDDGHGRRVHGRALECALSTGAERDDGRGDHRRD